LPNIYNVSNFEKNIMILKLKNKFDILGLFAISIVIIALIVQCVLIVVFWNVNQRSDQGLYIRMANEYFLNNQWYPDKRELYSNYLFAPGLINYFILQLKIFGTLKINMIINLILNLFICFYIFKFGQKFFSKKTAYIAIIIWSILYSNIMIVLPAGTEIPFLFLILTASYLCINYRSSWCFILSGVLFAIANWIRPLSLIFVISIIVYFVLNRYSYRSYLNLVGSIFVSIVIIGSISKHQIGIFTFQSSTSGVNLIMTANDKAYGGVATILFSDTTSSCYIRNANNLTFIQKDSIWKNRSFEWIRKHPSKYAFLYLKKLVGLFIEDSWSDRPILGGDGTIGNNMVKKPNSNVLMARISHMFVRSIVYYLVLILFVFGIFKNIKQYNINQHIFLLLSLLLGVFSTCIFCVSPRYHYPFLFVIVLYAASTVDLFILKRSHENT